MPEHKAICRDVFNTLWENAGGVKILADVTLLVNSGLPEEIVNRYAVKVPPIIPLEFLGSVAGDLNLAVTEEGIGASLSFHPQVVHVDIPWEAVRLLAAPDHSYAMQVPLVPAPAMKAPEEPVKPKLRAVEGGADVLPFRRPE